MPEHFIPPHGGYPKLLSYQKALVVFDATTHFCRRFIDPRSRTYDQMTQAARSGKQNIVEGSQVSGTSKEGEVKLTGVARASLHELLDDYRDFLRDRGIEEWPKTHRYAKRLGELCRQPGANYETFRKGVEHPDPAICANVILGLIKVTSRLLGGQLRRLESDFVQDGGLRERMTRARLAQRDADRKKPPEAQGDTHVPAEPKSIPRSRLVSTLGAAQPVWDAILASLADQLGALETEWKPSKSDFGSMCLLKHKGRTLLYLTPQDGSILVALVLGDRAVAQALDSAIPDSIKALIRDARPYAEGRGIRFPIGSTADVPLVTELVALKIAPR